VRPSAKAIITGAASAGALLFTTSTILDHWSSQYFWDSNGLDGTYALVDPPPPTGFEAIALQAIQLIWLCFLGAVWTAVVVLPIVLIARRILSYRWASRLLAVAIVGVLSALVCLTQWSPGGPWTTSLICAIGGVIGLVLVAIADRQMPPNKSLERTREG